MSFKQFLLITIAIPILSFGAVRSKSGRGDDNRQNQPSSRHQTTQWDIRPSMTLDALCFLNTLTADSFFMDTYGSEYAKFAPKITPKTKAALANLKRIIKDENQGIISALLCLYFSATDDSTLDDLIQTTADSRQMQVSLKKTAYYSADEWNVYDSSRADLKVVLQFLKDIKFDNYWRENIYPLEITKIDSIKTILPNYNIIPEIEEELGSPLPSNKVTVFMLYYTQPYGIRITGMRFITDISWPFDIVVRNAVHEMMHPPYQLKNNSQLAAAFDQLKKDDFLMDKVLHHNPSFGYNSFEGFIEEDCVQALDQIINEKLQVAKDAHHRWQENDDGMHIFAIALYQVMKIENYNRKHEIFQDFLIRNINSGALAPPKIKEFYNTFYPR